MLTPVLPSAAEGPMKRPSRLQSHVHYIMEGIPLQYFCCIFINPLASIFVVFLSIPWQEVDIGDGSLCQLFCGKLTERSVPGVSLISSPAVARLCVLREGHVVELEEGHVLEDELVVAQEVFCSSNAHISRLFRLMRTSAASPDATASGHLRISSSRMRDST